MWPAAVVQTCVVHLIRASMRYVSWKDRKAMTAALRYRVPTGLPYPAWPGGRSGGTMAVPPRGCRRLTQRGRSWSCVASGRTPSTPSPSSSRTGYPSDPTPPSRSVTTNLIESINFQLRKVTKARGSFPTDEAAMKLIYRALRNISDQRGGDTGTGDGIRPRRGCPGGTCRGSWRRGGTRRGRARSPDAYAG